MMSLDCCQQRNSTCNLSNSGVAVVWEHIMSVMVPILPKIYSLLNLKIAGILNLVGLS
jgi:hypothetical protein